MASHESHEFFHSDCSGCQSEMDEAMAEYGWMARAVRNQPTRDEREAIESDRELMVSEFHGRNVAGERVW